MHSCKATREIISELLLAEATDHSNKILSRDLENCDDCRVEFHSVRNALRITSRLIETVMPPDDYWGAYHASLKQKLINSQTHRVETSQPVARTSWLAGFFKSSVRVPVPVAIGLLLGFALSLLVVTRVSRQVDIPPQAISLVRVPVEVPVIMEKSVIRVVYRERKRRGNSSRSDRATSNSEIDSTVATHLDNTKPAGLAGFKPLDEIKLTVIKGGGPNEK